MQVPVSIYIICSGYCYVLMGVILYLVYFLMHFHYLFCYFSDDDICRNVAMSVVILFG